MLPLFTGHSSGTACCKGGFLVCMVKSKPGVHPVFLFNHKATALFVCARAQEFRCRMDFH